jgi:hypothetical protein
MSGVHFDYKCFEVSRFAEMVEMTIKERSVRHERKWSADYTEVIEPLPPELLAKLRLYVDVMKICGELARDIEWCMSGDTGEDDLLKDLNAGFTKMGLIINKECGP